MAQKKREYHEPISVELGGRTCTGTLFISGTRKLTATVEYRGQKRSDPRTWGTGSEEQHNMRVMAQSLLLQLIDEDKRR